MSHNSLSLKLLVNQIAANVYITLREKRDKYAMQCLKLKPKPSTCFVDEQLLGFLMMNDYTSLVITKALDV
ncbi:CLUMA_CG002861, isoform A [Clunio marinus]|uniref:CLUMA_CG002861, isoform A n=1 Tax=Clunio marinus TaxID=568069 RepID=A0A1J1HLH9_9DIPT|nr:CLUMA_CG002861, isoform A [Clunio marinus]